jgi:hypothetical protein
MNTAASTITLFRRLPFHPTITMRSTRSTSSESVSRRFWFRRGLRGGSNSTPFDHTSLLKYLIEKWNLGLLGNRTAQVKSIGPLIQPGPHRTDTVDWIELSPDELRPPDPDLEEVAAAFISSHHRALALIGHYLKLELDEDLPFLYSWLARRYEDVKQWLFGKATTAEAILKNYEAAKGHCLAFLDRRKKQAVPKLAATIHNPQLPEPVRRHAAEPLGYVVNRHLHREPDPIRAAQHWLQRHGH